MPDTRLSSDVGCHRRCVVDMAALSRAAQGTVGQTGTISVPLPCSDVNRAAGGLWQRMMEGPEQRY